MDKEFINTFLSNLDPEDGIKETITINDRSLYKSNNNLKVKIDKFELSKAVNVGSQSGEAGYALIPRSYDKENRKFEDGVVSNLDDWIRDREKNLKIELKRFYEDLDY